MDADVDKYGSQKGRSVHGHKARKLDFKNAVVFCLQLYLMEGRLNAFTSALS